MANTPCPTISVQSNLYIATIMVTAVLVPYQTLYIELDFQFYYWLLMLLPYTSADSVLLLSGSLNMALFTAYTGYHFDFMCVYHLYVYVLVLL